ncbi:hypothetical protein MPL3356_60216 [Mesorhizobium plurifarium]|uniref:Uncharacterized protein n=1 Tax=Mesorhizobium plurifarium TaxID=69974 RepID=A0A090EDK3_MESPL|nr:hypothetical protein MPL3356_60216 [Mesorhizobium plurifarium]
MRHGSQMGNSCNCKLSPAPSQVDAHTKTPPGKPGGVEFSNRIVLGDKAETSGGHGAGLARHGLGEALTLQSGRQVHFAAGEQAGKELHHPSPFGCSDGSPSLKEWGSSFLLRPI